MNTGLAPTGGFTSTLIETTFYDADTPLTGQIKGNLVAFQAKGKWTKVTFTRTTHGSTIDPSLPVSSEIPFFVTVQGRATEDQLLFHFQFDYPSLGEQSKGECVANRLK
jgi:hypothetical protein